MAQIINITSEALQATIRRLLPSQQGLGEDLQATNVVTPIIDLTPTAEGSSIPEYLQTAINFTDATAFSISNATTDIVTSPGFYRIFGAATMTQTTASGNTCDFELTDGLAVKDVWKLLIDVGSNNAIATATFDFTVFLQAGETFRGRVSSGDGNLSGSARQVATVDGVLVNPTGFTPQ